MARLWCDQDKAGRSSRFSLGFTAGSPKA